MIVMIMIAPELLMHVLMQMLDVRLTCKRRNCIDFQAAFKSIGVLRNNAHSQVPSLKGATHLRMATPKSRRPCAGLPARSRCPVSWGSPLAAPRSSCP